MYLPSSTKFDKDRFVLVTATSLACKIATSRHSNTGRINCYNTVINNYPFWFSFTEIKGYLQLKFAVFRGLTRSALSLSPYLAIQNKTQITEEKQGLV